ncbi:MAG: DEAD/DEAH box helicase [Chloroflexota bacterium]
MRRTHYPLQPRQQEDEETKAAVAWHAVLSDLQRRSGLALQTDVSATLFEERSGQWFRHTVYDYPLRAAIRDGVVKRPYLGKVTLRYRDGHDEPIPLIDDSATNAWDKYSQLLQAGIADWKRAQADLDAAGQQRKAILFIVCNNKSEAAQVARRLEEFPDPESGELPFAGRVKEIHIGLKEGTNDQEWRKVRDEVTRIDAPDNPYTAVVSVMMLKEGWDVRNVKVIVPLRPCDSRQLTEQLLGRGLRRMFPPYWTADGELKDRDTHEALYVIRHPSFERIIKDIQDIVDDGDTVPLPPPDATRLVITPVEPAAERARRDLPIVQIVGAYETSDDWVDRIDRTRLPPLAQRFPWDTDLHDVEGIIINEGFGGAIGEEEVHYRVQQSAYGSLDAVITSYAESIRAELRIARYYEAPLAPALRRRFPRSRRTPALPAIWRRLRRCRAWSSVIRASASSTPAASTPPTNSAWRNCWTKPRMSRPGCGTTRPAYSSAFSTPLRAVCPTTTPTFWFASPMIPSGWWKRKARSASGIG